VITVFIQKEDINFSIYGSAPVMWTFSVLTEFRIRPYYTKTQRHAIIKNVFDTFDNWLLTVNFLPTIEGLFYSSKQITDYTQSDDGTGRMYDASFIIDD